MGKLNRNKKNKSMKESNNFGSEILDSKVHRQRKQNTTQKAKRKSKNISLSLKDRNKTLNLKNTKSKIKVNVNAKNIFNVTSEFSSESLKAKCELSSSSSTLSERKNSKHFLDPHIKCLSKGITSIETKKSKKLHSLKNKEFRNITSKDMNVQVKRQCSNEGLPKSKKVKKDKKRLKQLSEESHSGCGKEKSKSTDSQAVEKRKYKTASVLPNNSKHSKKNSIEESEDSDEDIEIRNEVKNLSIYKKIQKLLKDNPSLCSGFDENLTNEDDSVEIAENDLTDDDDSLEIGEYGSTNSDESILDTCSNQNDNCTAETANFSRTLIKKSSKAATNDIKTAKISNQIHVPDYVKMYREEGKLCRDPQSKSEKKNSTPVRNKAREKLQAAKFRYLNEKLYTESGKDSFAYFQNNKDEFQDYHAGYSLQVSKWPVNPVDKVISSLQNLDRNAVIADLGCGDAKIARTLDNCSVYSYDLVALNEHVTPCNISKVPLSNESVDVVVFCLSLMGTSLKEYLLEAHRILKTGGSLKIAEVESRIPDLDQFIKSIQSLGFILENKDMQNKMFVFLEFKKDKKKKKGVKVQEIVLNPCLYKKR